MICRDVRQMRQRHCLRCGCVIGRLRLHLGVTPAIRPLREVQLMLPKTLTAIAASAVRRALATERWDAATSRRACARAWRGLTRPWLGRVAAWHSSRGEQSRMSVGRLQPDVARLRSEGDGT